MLNNTTKSVIWESFDHPTDTMLPYLRLGFDRKTNQSWSLQSWKTDDDPGKGAFTVKFSTIGKPQLYMYNHDLPWWRGGHWNGELIVGLPNMKRDMAMSNISFVEDDDYVALSYYTYDKSIISRIVVQQSGFSQTFTWDSQKSQWIRYWSDPNNPCDNYGTCGSNSNCDPSNFEDFKCTCLPGFEPKFPRDWYQSIDGSGGCVRKKGVSDCRNGEGFVKVESLKVPDTSVAVAKDGLSLEECEKECFRNCSCTAYAVADVRNGGTGCLTWHGNLTDIQKLSDQGQDLYLRVDKVELANYYKKGKGVLDKKRLSAILVASIVAITIILTSANYLWKKKRKDDMMRQLNQESSGEENGAQSNTNPNLPFFNFKTIMTATRNCGHENKLGQGGFGSVYKGCLVNGQEIAVKRLFKHSVQGKEDYGVLLLEIIAGQKNTHCERRASPNLIGHVWILWTEGRALDTVDLTLNQSYPYAIVMRCIQIGLLCVQENAMNRPTMTEVVFMLCNETPLCQPQKPAFLFNGKQDLQESSTSRGGSSINEITETIISAR
ncbi:S-locus lectin protein kinase family protein [Trifolium repens]|nr:S-locus lectin protein kinase family protein [Trifolium repens]